jgi:RES domain-containing protein
MTRYANDLTGAGSRLFGARWNHKLTACLYTSETRALAVLEYTVNINMDDIPRALSITTLNIPNDSIRELKISDLPGDWSDPTSPMSTKDFGTALLQSATHLVLKIPSAIIPAEFNYLIDPAHRNMSKVSIVDVRDFVYDLRIKAV